MTFAAVTRVIRHFKALVYFRYHFQIREFVINTSFKSQWSRWMTLSECASNIKSQCLHIWHYATVSVYVCVERVFTKQARSQPSLMWSSVSTPYQQHFVVPASLSLLCVCTTSPPDSQQPPRYTCSVSHRCWQNPANRASGPTRFPRFVLLFTCNFSRDLMYIIANSRVYIICTLCWCKRVHCIYSQHTRICGTAPCVREYVHSIKRIKTQTHKIISPACFHTWRQQIEQLSVAARISPFQWQLGGEEEGKRRNNYAEFAYNTFQSSSCFSSSGVQTSER